MKHDEMQPRDSELDNPGVCGTRLVTAIIIWMLSGADLIIMPPQSTEYTSTFGAADTAGWIQHLLQEPLCSEYSEYSGQGIICDCCLITNKNPPHADND